MEQLCLSRSIFGLQYAPSLSNHFFFFFKDRNFSVVLDVLTRFRTNEVEKAVKTLDSDQIDMLMKYIYRGFQEPTENSCGILLVWHEKVIPK